MCQDSDKHHIFSIYDYRETRGITYTNAPHQPVMEKQGKPWVELRSVQQTGGSTFTVSLPKPWAKEHRLKAKDQLRIEWSDQGHLRISPRKSKAAVRKESTLMMENIPNEFILDHLIAAYLSGAQLIKITSKEGFTRPQMRVFRTFIQSTRGMDITHEEDNLLEMFNLISPTEMPLQASLNRMYLLLTHQIRDIHDVLTGDQISILDDSSEVEREIDALRLLFERQVGQILSSARIEENLGVGRWEAAELSNIARTLERIGDHIYQISQLATTHDIPKGLKETDPPLNALPIWRNSMKTLVMNLKKQKAKEIHGAKSRLNEARKELRMFEESLWTSGFETSKAIFYVRLSESIRRICAYAGDMAEILLNIQAYRNSIEATIK